MNKNQEIADRMGVVAHELLAKLSADQLRIAQWPFPSDEERKRWFYTPTDHGGLTVSGMTPSQQRLAMKLLSTGLSRAGYVTASTIMGLENILDELEDWKVSYGHERGRDPARYYLRIFGVPGSDSWSWRFGGHHISVNHTIVGRELRAFTPCFFGADPAESPMLGPHTLRPLAASADYAFELLGTLSAEQRSVAVLSPVAPVDLVGGNRIVLQDGDGPPRLNQIWRTEFTGEIYEFLEKMQDREEARIGLTPAQVDAMRYSTKPKGLAASALSKSQKETLRALLETYVKRMPEAVADAEMTRIAGKFDELHLAWAGSQTPGRPYYYRIHGPRLLVEYDNTTRDSNHVHSVWRDPVADFGVDALSAHYRKEH